LLSVAGTPPLTGLFGKFMLFSDAFADYKWLVLLAVINSVIGVFIYLRIILGLLNVKGENTRPAIEIPITKSIVLVACSLILLLGWLSLYWIA